MKNLDLAVEIGVLIDLQTERQSLPIIEKMIAEIELLESEIDRLRTEKSRNLAD